MSNGRWTRRRVIETLLAGSSAFSAGPSNAQSLPNGMNNARGILKAMSGMVHVDGRMATNGMPIKAPLQIVTGVDSMAVLILGTQVISMRAGTRLEIQPQAQDPYVAGVLRLVTGAISSVSRSSLMSLVTPDAAVGIRGTGFYASCESHGTYFCTCYGQTEVAVANEKTESTSVTSHHHDRPLSVMRRSARLPRGSIENAPFSGHSDEELISLEKLVGRKPPFLP